MRTNHPTIIGQTILYNDDCFNIFPLIESKSIDCIICDLPYGTTSCSWDVVIPFDKLWEQYKRIIKDKGTIVLFGSEPFSSHLRLSNIEWYKYDWIWEKNNASNFQLVNYQPLKIHETISIFINDSPNFEFSTIMYENMSKHNLKQIDISRLQLSKTGGITGWVTNKLNGTQLPTREQWSKICNLFQIEDAYDEILSTVKYPTYNMELEDVDIVCSNKNKGGSLGHLSSETIRKNYTQIKTGYPKSILNFPRENKPLHPTQKPLDLLEFLIKTYSNEGDLILDNCMGVGTTNVACSKLNRKSIGIEKETKYFNIALDRLLKLV